MQNSLSSGDRIGGYTLIAWAQAGKDLRVRKGNKKSSEFDDKDGAAGTLSPRSILTTYLMVKNLAHLLLEVRVGRANIGAALRLPYTRRPSESPPLNASIS